MADETKNARHFNASFANRPGGHLPFIPDGLMAQMGIPEFYDRFLKHH
jgi:hypothetical protein